MQSRHLTVGKVAKFQRYKCLHKRHVNYLYPLPISEPKLHKSSILISRNMTLHAAETTPIETSVIAEWNVELTALYIGH